MEASDEGVTILDAAFPETIGVDAEAQAEVFVSALGYFMQRGKKMPAALRALSVDDVNDLRTAVAGSTLRILTA
jgi:hypothetical protein